MKVGVMQPYLFPYLGYFQLMSYVDIWVFFDDIQFEKKGWVSRNRISHPNKSNDFQYLVSPLKKSYLKKINEIAIDQKPIDLKKNFLGKISAFKKKAVGYDVVRSLITNIFDHNYSENFLLSELLYKSLIETKKVLGIETKILLQDDINFNRNLIESSGDWAFEIARTLKADEYVNPENGAFLFSRNKFDAAGIKLSFLSPSINMYPMHQHKMLSLSIIDVLLWNDLDWVMKQINMCDVK